jgi:hypothetical protein
MFFLTLDFILFVFLLNECGRTKYPDQHNQLLENVMYYSLYMYSIGEELFKERFYPLFAHEDIVINNLDLILDDGDNYITDTELLSTDQDIPDDYKFAIYTRLDADNAVRNKRIYKQLPEDGVYDCDETSYRFVLIEVKYGDTTFKLNFDNAKTTYYVVNNEFDSNVIRYLFAKEFDVELPEQFKVCILDHNVSRFEFNETQVLRLNKDDYEVLDVEESEESESVKDESESKDETN